MSYRINPCKACWKKHKDGECNINTMNDCVVDTATAFTEFPSNNSLRDNKFDINWHDCMENVMSGMPKVAGKNVDFSTLRLGMAPRWVSTPHYFPSSLDKTGDKEKALEMCVKKCGENDYLMGECMETCKTDYDAVEKVSVEGYDGDASKYKRKLRRSRARAHRAMTIITVLCILLFAVVLVYLTTK
jgi:hypothetical protein